MQFIINLGDAQASRLDAWAKAEKISCGETVRCAVTQMLERAASPPGTGFGLWAQGLDTGHKSPADRDVLACKKLCVKPLMPTLSALS